MIINKKVQDSQLRRIAKLFQEEAFALFLLHVYTVLKYLKEGAYLNLSIGKINLSFIVTFKNSGDINGHEL